MKKLYISLILVIIAIGAAYFIDRIMDSKNSSLIQDRVIADNPVSGAINPISGVITTTNSTNKKSSQKTEYRLPKLTNDQKAVEKKGRNPFNSTIPLSNIGLIKTDPDLDSDNDGISDSAEVLDFNTDPLQATIIDTTPGINNLNETTTGGSPIIKGNAKAGEIVTIVAKNLSTGKITPICETEADSQEKFLCFPEKELEDGNYYLYSNHEPEKGKTTDDRKVVLIKVNHAQAQQNPIAEIQKIPNMTIVLSDTQSVLSILTKFFGESFAEENFRAPLEKLLASKNQTTKLVGKANPGDVIVATWKSIILSSVVIADASQGTFEMLIPGQLSSGQHDIFVYAFNSKLNLISNITKLKFFKS